VKPEAPGGVFLCQPGQGLSCLACCPPIRPAGYDHADDRGSWRRILSDNRAAFLRGELPDKPMLGFFCPGLGFLDARGVTAGCLLHPAGNGGRDLRGPTGYAGKCARESCPAARAFAALAEPARAALLAACAGLDVFAFSSRRLNPVMRLLAFGPAVAGAAAGLGGLGLERMRGWSWLAGCEPAWGWLLGLALEQAGPELLGRPGLDQALGEAAGALARALGPRPPLEQGPALAGPCGEWEARLWLALAGRRRLPGDALERWRGLARRAAAGLA
jgi:hypothetical protein